MLYSNFLLNNAAVFALGRFEGQLKRMQTPTIHRGVLLKLQAPYFDEYGVCYGEISVKGTGMTPSSLAAHLTSSKFMLKESGNKMRELAVSQEDPLGFFGYHHAQQEQRVSNSFAQFGGRNGRVIGILLLNHKEFLKWFSKLPESFSDYPVREMLTRVAENRDKAALCVRLQGTERVEDCRRALSSAEGLYNPTQMNRRSARLLLMEIKARGEQDFFDYYQMRYPENKLGCLSDSLLKIVKGEPGLSSLLFLRSHFFYWNLAVKKRLSDQLYQSKLTVNMSYYNIDLAGFWYDWETSLPGPGYMPSDTGWPNFIYNN